MLSRITEDSRECESSLMTNKNINPEHLMPHIPDLKKGLTHTEIEEQNETDTTIDFYVLIEKVQVKNPKTISGGKISYTISGYDKLGYFENFEKRYHDFY